MSLFTKLGQRYPQFSRLSSTRFSKLDRRTEMYPIIKRLRVDLPVPAGKTFAGYPNKSTADLGALLYTFIKDLR